jgi:hypothetical protein
MDGVTGKVIIRAADTGSLFEAEIVAGALRLDNNETIYLVRLPAEEGVPEEYDWLTADCVFQIIPPPALLVKGTALPASVASVRSEQRTGTKSEHEAISDLSERLTHAALTN